MVEPTDAVADPGVRSITLIKASRCSGTELINNVAAWSVNCRPMPAIYVLPRADDVEEEFKGRLKRIIEASPKLQAHVPGGNWATEEAIAFDTMTIISASCTRAGDFIRRTTARAPPLAYGRPYALTISPSPPPSPPRGRGSGGSPVR